MSESTDLNLVSCIMPTRARPGFAHEALRLWTLQTWPWKELVILDDLDARSFPDGCSGIPDVQYHLLEQRLDIGAKRNVAVSRARGDIVAHWDDDDYSSPRRLEDQVSRLLGTGAQVTGYHLMTFVCGTRHWLYEAPYPPNGYALGTSLVYRKDFWRRHPFADVRTGEDTHFVKTAAQENSLVTVPAGEFMHATIHPGNTCPRNITSAQFKELTCA